MRSFDFFICRAIVPELRDGDIATAEKRFEEAWKRPLSPSEFAAVHFLSLLIAFVFSVCVVAMLFDSLPRDTRVVVAVGLILLLVLASTAFVRAVVHSILIRGTFRSG